MLAAFHSNGSAAIRSAEHATTRIEGNTLRDGRDCGIAVCAGATSVVLDNDIYSHVKVTDRLGSPTDTNTRRTQTQASSLDLPYSPHFPGRNPYLWVWDVANPTS